MGSDLGLLKFIIVLFLILGIIKVLISFFKNYYLNFFNRNLDTEIFTDFLQHIFKLPLKFIQNRTTGEVISRVQELSEIKSMLAEFLTNVILNSILIIGSIIVLYFINAKLFFLLCLIISIYIIVGLIFNKVIYEQVNECIISATEFNETLVEHVEMIESIKHMNLTKKFLYELNSKLIKMFKRDFKFQSLLNVIDFLKNFIYEIGLFLITTFGVYLIYKGDLQLLSLVTFNSIIIYLFNPVKDLIDLIPKYNYLKASFNKISEFLNIPEEEEGVGLKNINDTTIEALDVGYSYNKITNILEHVNFKINPQDKVFLKGPSGSGKSTICNLIIENQLENMGIIMIGDACKQDYDIEALRSNILYVGQNEKLFTGTIRDNIVCFRDVLDEDFKKVIKICKLEEVINKRPNRFNFMLNAALNNLSGGERQRIILARGLLKDAKIIILDEALSEVNFEMEKEIINNIKEHFKDKTLIYVSHKKVDNLFNKVIDLGEAYG